MDRKELESYRSKRAEIRELKEKIRIEVDANLWGHYAERLEELEACCKAVDNFVEGIRDSLTRRIFRMTYIDGLTQREVGRAVNLDHSRISRKITEYLQMEEGGQNACITDKKEVVRYDA